MFPVMEIFGPTVQGEGMLVGKLMHFVRTGGCPLRCSWCDEMRSVDPLSVKQHATWLTAEQIHTQLSQLPYVGWVSLTGGDPCIHKLDDLIHLLQAELYNVAVETQGTVFPAWLKRCNAVTFSPKPPSSGNIVNFEPIIEWIDTANVDCCLKIVVDTTTPERLAADFNYVLKCQRAVKEAYSNVDVYMTAITPQGIPKRKIVKEVLASYRRLTNYVLEFVSGVQDVPGARIRDARMLHIGCQQHTLIWPGETEGR